MGSADSTALFSAVLEHLPGAVLVETPKRHVRYVTASLCELFGVPMSPAALVGLDCATLLEGAKQAFSDPHRFATSIDRALAGGRPVLETFEMRDGRVVTRAYAPLVGEVEGHMWHYRIAADGAAERDDMRQKVRYAEAANVAKTSFLATMSHEIRTPLNAIVGLTELAVRSEPTPKVKGYLAGIRAGSESLLTLINGVLDFSKIEAGHLDITPHPTDPSDTVRRVCSVYGSAAAAKGIELWSHCEAGIPKSVLVDEGRLRQVLVNLVGNALKFTDTGCICVSLDSAPGPNNSIQLRVRVTDTGIGIAQEEFETIFESFKQSRKQKNHPGGTGLGLAISRSLVRAMGGDISCTSVLGEGSVFSVELSVPIVADGLQAGPRMLPAANAHIAVLGVHEPMLGMSYGKMLSEMGSHPHLTTAQEFGSVARDTPLAAVVCHRTDVPKDLPVGVAVVRVRQTVENAPGDIPIPINELALNRALSAVLTQGRQPTSPFGPVLEPTPSRRLATILVAEDDRSNQAIIVHLLQDEGYRVDVVPDGLRAVEACQHRTYELVLMDIEMPELDGFQATERIRANEAARGEEATPIIAVTAHATKSVRQRCLDIGMNDYMSKPLDPTHLIDVVRRAIGQRLTILIVDDCVEQRSLLSFYFDPKMYHLVLAASGREALKTVGRRTIDLAIVDMQMPGMSGLDLVREMRELPSAEAIPIIALTASRGSDREAECLAAGCTEFMSKPARRGPLLRAVKRLLNMPMDVRPTAPEATQRNLPVIGSKILSNVTVSNDMRALVEDYIVIVRSTIDSLRDNLDATNMLGVKRQGHNLVGSGAAYGFEYISIIGRKLEDCEVPPDGHALVNDLEAFLDRLTIRYE